MSPQLLPFMKTNSMAAAAAAADKNRVKAQSHFTFVRHLFGTLTNVA